MQHERIGVAPEFGDDEWRALRHEAGDEGDIARQPVQLGDQDAALRPFGGRECGCELRSPIECIGALAQIRTKFHAELMERPACRKKTRPGGESGEILQPSGWGYFGVRGSPDVRSTVET